MTVRNHLALLAVLALAACGVNAPKLTAEAQKLVAQYSPQVASIVKDGDALAARVKALPADVPGLPDLAAKIAAHQSKLAALKTRVSEFPEDLAATIQVGKEADITALFDKFKKEVPEDLAAAGPRLQELASQLAALEARSAQRTVSASASAPAK
jgi:uncharacterized protein involved in exopolysaccharide biosynthesis